MATRAKSGRSILVATYRGMMVRATLTTLNTQQAGELRIVQVVVAGNGETNLPIIEPPCKLTDSSPFRGAKNDDRKSTGSIISWEIFVFNKVCKRELGR